MWPFMHCEETSTLQNMQRYCRYAGSVDIYVQLAGCVVDVLQCWQVCFMSWAAKTTIRLCQI